MIITTGSCCVPIEFKTGDIIVAEFKKVGKVRAKLK